MFTSIKVKTPMGREEWISFVCPLGAAAYNVTQDPAFKTVKVTFAMMKVGESGLDAILRVVKAVPASWKAVAAQPSEQMLSVPGNSDYTQYTFAWVNNAWQPTTDIQAQFMKALSAAQSLPASAPTELAISLAKLTGLQQ